MFGTLAKYIKGVSLALQVRSGAGGVYHAGARAAEGVQRAVQVIPAARLEVVTAAETVLAEGLAQNLEATPLEDLAKLGGRPGPFVAAGYRTVQSIDGKTVWQLQNIRGVGEVIATDMVAARERCKDSIKAGLRVLPDPDRPRASDDRLLVAVVRYDILTRQLPERLKSVQTKLAEAQAGLQALRAETRLWPVLFSLGEQATLAEKTAQAEARIRWLQEESAILERYTGELQPNPGEVRRQYQENSALFVAILENLLPTAQIALPPGEVGPDMRGGLPAEIADAVEALHLEKGPLLATLRRYQQFGAQYVICQKRTILGDDMGLGKTVQVLAAMCHLSAKGARHFFVVAPNSVLINWEREVAKHTGLKPTIIHGADREDEVAQWRREGGVGITTYTTLTRLAQLIGPIDLLAIDEAHLVKNPDAQRTQAVQFMAARAEYLVLMTGTALENRLEEMHTLVTMAQPDALTALQVLLKQFRPRPAEVRTGLAPVYLRRTQADVLKELPDLVLMDEHIPLEPKDKEAYAMAPDNLMNKRMAATLGQGNRDSAKYDRLRELFDGYREDGRKIAVFTSFLRVLEDVSQIAAGCEKIHGGVPTLERQRMIDDFTKKEGFAVLALQIDAGGLGINLQSAQVVILMEPQFKPSTERQAIARVRRMGQTRKVYAHRFIAQGTVDEALVLMVEQKAEIFEAYAQHSAVKQASQMAIDGASGALLEELKKAVGE